MHSSVTFYRYSPQKLPVTLPLRPLCIVLHWVHGIVVSILWSFYAYFCDILQFKGTNLLKIPLTISFNPVWRGPQRVGECCG